MRQIPTAVPGFKRDSATSGENNLFKIHCKSTEQLIPRSITHTVTFLPTIWKSSYAYYILHLNSTLKIFTFKLCVLGDMHMGAGV